MTEKEAIALTEISNLLGIKTDWLYSVINFESKWNPKAVARMPYNKSKVDAGQEQPKYAKGLIQFIDSTAQELGFKDSQDLINQYPDIESQLRGPVYKYLKKYDYPTEQSFYMAIFYPAYRFVSLDTPVTSAIANANPGIKTVNDYVNLVKRSIASINVKSSYLIPIAILAIIIIIKKYS